MVGTSISSVRAARFIQSPHCLAIRLVSLERLVRQTLGRPSFLSLSQATPSCLLSALDTCDVHAVSASQSFAN